MSEANIRRYGYVYVITSPTGEKIETNNLREFCREHNLPFATMRRVVIGERLEYYGWKGYRYKGDNQD